MMNWSILEYRRFVRIFEKNVINFNAYEVVDTLTNIGMLITFELQCEQPNSRLVLRFNELSFKFANLIQSRIK